MNVKIDTARDKIEVVNPLTGKIEECSIVRTLNETDAYDSTAAAQLELANTQKALLQLKVDFLESKLSTLSISDWNEYNEIK